MSSAGSGGAATEVIGKVFDQKDDASNKKESVIVPKDFYWDQVIFYLVTIMFGLSFVDISVEFFRGSRVKCFTPTEIPLELDHFAYLNNHCYGSLPDSQYYLVFLLSSGLAILGPHFLWNAYFSKHIDFFFDLLKKLDRLRDPNIGEYNQLNFAYVKKLEERFSNFKSAKIFIFYIAKIGLQLCICVGILLANCLYFKNEEFKADFICTVQLVDSIWPYNNTIPCSYNTLSLLRFLWVVEFFILAACISTLVYGLYWCCIDQHGTELGAKDIAKFCFESCLQPINCPVDRPPLLIALIRKCSKHESSSFLRISNDLDFLLMKLYVADSGHGQVFKDIQIYKELNGMIEHDQEIIHVMLRVRSDMLKQKTLQTKNDDDQEQQLREKTFEAGKETDLQKMQLELSVDKNYLSSISEIRKLLIECFSKFAKCNKVAVDVTFESKIGYSLILTRVFHKVTTVFYDRHYRNPNDVVRMQKFPAGYDIVTYPDNIYSSTASDTTEADKCLSDIFNARRTHGKGKVNLITIGPITDRSKLISATFLINKIHERSCIAENAVIFTIRPLIIGDKIVMQHFHKYIPTERLFKCEDKELRKFLLKNHKEKITPLLDNSDSHTMASTTTDELSGRSQQRLVMGVRIICHKIECIFEICVYKYTGVNPPENPPRNLSVQVEQV